jgi:hypothetical protein
MWIVVVPALKGDFQYFGTFPSEEAARDWANKMIQKSFLVRQVNEVTVV